MRTLALFVVVAFAGYSFGEERDSKAPPPKNEPLRQELRKMFKEDQAARIGMMKALQQQGVSMGIADAKSMRSPKALWTMALYGSVTMQVDRDNQKRLKEIISKEGWPGKSLVGNDGANAAWIIAQHADSDVAFQKECLALMEAAPPDEVRKSDVAYLTDRVLVAEGKKQRFGTQMGPNFKPQPIEDEANVDARRASVGLQPLAEYLREAEKAYQELSK